jgi:hypothetical protein
MAYRLALHDSLKRVQDVFHVSFLRHYVSNPSHVIEIFSLQVLDEGSLMADPVHILYHHTRQLQCLIVDQVKVHSDNYSPHSATWEDAYEMCQ